MLPQLIPLGLLVTVPDPVPDLETDNVYVGIAVTANENVPDFPDTPDDVPVYDTDVVPALADVVAEYANVTLQLPDVGVHDKLFDDVNDTPLGNVPTATVTGCAVPCVVVIVTVCCAVDPCCIVTPGTDNE